MTQIASSFRVRSSDKSGSGARMRRAQKLILTTGKSMAKRHSETAPLSPELLPPIDRNGATKNPNSFAIAMRAFDEGVGGRKTLARSLVPVNGLIRENIAIRSSDGKPLEEYYKWQFLSGLINSGLYPRDYVGAEVYFPKGTRGSTPLKLDAAIFDDPAWIQHYNNYWNPKTGAPRSNMVSLQWLNDHLVAAIEFKRDEREIAQVFAQQVKPAMREKDPSTSYVFGMYYDEGRLLLFCRREGKYLRYDEAKNEKGDASNAGDLSLHIPDPYYVIPSFNELKQRAATPTKIDRSNRTIYDLDIITSIATVQVRDALSDVLRVMDKAGLVNQRGYEILIQAFALKI
jgi:type I restriction enzyme M protein